VKVLVVGGGIGGLATALSLHDAGIESRVYESVATLAELGVGINLLPHAVRELTELGLLERLRGRAIETAELVYFNKFGQEIWREPRGLAAGYRWPQLSIHRGRLRSLLLAAVLERLGPDAVVTGHHLEAIDVHADGGVTAHFVDRARSTRVASVRGDCLVAADGIHSRLRALLNPGEGKPIWNGAVLWRGITEAAPFLSGASMFMAGHQSQKFVAYPIGAASDRRGLSEVNWIAELRFPVRELSEREDWNRAGKLADFLPAFASWRFPWLDIPALIRGARAVYEFPMVDRDPLPCWSSGPVTLLGDAAHPMYPIGSNGASQAILDARVLARSLVRHGHPADAFAAYEAERRPATAAIVLANRGNGPEQVMQLAEERAPDGFDDIEAVIPFAERAAIANRYKQVAGFEKDVLNVRPSLSVGDRP
jgi:2-polyprenyl-6-methoxyphenol hydroxylase-like FAD-dependent oxidoreductase